MTCPEEVLGASSWGGRTLRAKEPQAVLLPAVGKASLRAKPARRGDQHLKKEKKSEMELLS